MHEETGDWGPKDWQLYKQLVRKGSDGKPMLSQAAIREVNRRRRSR